MTNLDATQQRLLDAVGAENATYSSRLLELKERYEQDKLEAQQDLVTAVQNAYDAGVPKRRIHIEGLGTKDSKTLTDMLTAATPGVTDEPTRTGPGVRKVDDVYIVTDRKQRQWEFWLVDLGDTQAVERSEMTELGAATASLKVTPEVFNLLRIKFPKADLSSFLEEEE